MPIGDAHKVYMRAKLLTKLAAFSLLATSAFGAGEGWMTDFEAAKKKAAAENKDLLLEFTGSDWCPPCKTLNQNVFSKPEFVTDASKKFVLVALDYPNKKQLPAAEKAQNDKLIGLYKVDSFPTILLCDASGMPYARHGFQEGGPAKYLTSLVNKMPAKTSFKKAIATAQTLKGKAKADALWASLNALEGVPVGLSFDPILKQIKAADPTDADGKITGIYMDSEMAVLKEGDDYKPLFAKYDAYIAKTKVTGEAKQKIMTKKLDILYKMKDFAGMRTTINEIIAIDPESRMGKGLTASKPRIDMMEEAFKKEQSTNKEPAKAK